MLRSLCLRLIYIYILQATDPSLTKLFLEVQSTGIEIKAKMAQNFPRRVKNQRAENRRPTTTKKPRQFPETLTLKLRTREQGPSGKQRLLSCFCCRVVTPLGFDLLNTIIHV